MKSHESINASRRSLYISLIIMMFAILIIIFCVFYFQRLITNRYIPKHELIIHLKNQLIKADIQFNKIITLNKTTDTLSFKRNLETISMQLSLMISSGMFNDKNYLKTIDKEIVPELLKIQNSFSELQKTSLKIISEKTTGQTYEKYLNQYEEIILECNTIEKAYHNYISKTSTFIWYIMLITVVFSVILFIFMLRIINKYIVKYKTSNIGLYAANQTLTSQIEENKILFEQSNKTNSFLTELFKNLNGGILFEDENRNAIYVNKYIADFFGLEPTSQKNNTQLDCKNAAQDNSQFFNEPEKFIAETNRCLENKKPDLQRVYHMNDGKILERDYIPVFMEEQFYGHLWYFRDITEYLTSQKRLEESEKQYRYLFEKNPNPMWIFDNETLQFTEVNQAAISKYGFSRDEFLTLSILQIRPPNEINTTLSIIKENENRQLVKNENIRHLSKNQELIDVEIYSNNIIFNGRKGRFNMVNDVTQLKKARKELLDYQQHLEETIQVKTQELTTSNQQLQLAIERMNMALQAGSMVWWEWNIQTQSKEYSSLACEMLGFSSNELTITVDNFNNQIIPCHREFVIVAMQKLITNQTDYYEVEFQIKHKTGHYLWCKEYGKIIETFSDNKPKRIVGIAQDITQQKNAQSEIRKWNHLIQQANWGIAIASAHSPVIKMANHAFANMFGYTSEQLHGAKLSDYFAPDEQSHYQEMTKLLMEKRKISVETNLTKKDGTKFTVFANADMLDDEETGESYVIINLQDITEHRKLEKQNRLWAKLIQNVNWGVYVIKAHSYKFEMMNDAFAQMHGYSNDEIMHINFDQLIVEEEKINMPKWIENVHKYGNYTIESINIKKDGSRIPVIVNITIVKDEESGEEYIVSNLQDISERKTYEQSLDLKRKELEELNKEYQTTNSELKSANNILSLTKDELILEKEKYSAIAENFPDGRVSLFDRELRYFLVNGAGSSNFVLNSEFLLNKTIYEALTPDLVAIVEPYYLKTLDGIKSKFEVKIRDSYFELQTVPIKNRENFIYAGMLIIHDITDRKTIETNILQSLQKEKELNDLKSEFISIASHQFRTPLAAIQSSIDILNLYLKSFSGDNKEQFQKHFHRINQEVFRLTDLVSDFLTIGRHTSGKTPFSPTQTDIVELCNNIIDMHYSNLPNQRKIELISEQPQIITNLDQKLISNAISNLLSNAIKYSTGNPQIHISILNNNLVIEVSDNGIGIPKEEQHKMFNSFFRAKNAQHIQGTGLGLVIVKQFIEQHNGIIDFQSNSEQGTKFIIRIPMNELIHN